MKTITTLILIVVSQCIAAAEVLHPKRIEPDLGQALGFQVYRYEVDLGSEEVLIVREIFEDGSKRTECEYAAVGSNVHTSYDIVVVDSGAYHPSLRDTYMLRFPNSSGFIEKRRMSSWGDSGDGGIELVFNDLTTDKPTLKRKWIAALEKYSDVVKRWPDLPKPKDHGCSGSRRLVHQEG